VTSATDRAAAAAPVTTSGPPAGENVDTTPDCCKTPNDATSAASGLRGEAQTLPGRFQVPHAVLVDQDGRSVRLYEDLVKGRVVIMNFIFTTCRGVCPPLGANFAALQKQLGEGASRDISLISISVDPATDTPERLKAWAGQFDARPGWTLLTGPKADVDAVLKLLGVFAANKNDHSPFLLIGSEAAGHWTRVHGLTSPGRVAEIARQVVQEGRTAGGSGDGSPRSPIPVDKSSAAAKRYFGDIPLVNQHGKEMRLYSDLLHGKTVVIHSFFAECKGSCPTMLTTFARIQEHLKDRVGKDVHLLSISVDPGRDTPARLEAYASSLHAQPGWYFLTGSKTNCDAALHKFGLRVDAREDHSNLFIIGNETTGLWKKAMGLAAPEDLIAIIDGVIDDVGPAAGDLQPIRTEKP
jgi:cytochrome oxidase Cu insertion factor (SCO1/SenC/PrrC family)